jgi:hypothetical protein
MEQAHRYLLSHAYGTCEVVCVLGLVMSILAFLYIEPRPGLESPSMADTPLTHIPCMHLYWLCEHLDPLAFLRSPHADERRALAFVTRSVVRQNALDVLTAISALVSRATTTVPRADCKGDQQQLAGEGDAVSRYVDSRIRAGAVCRCGHAGQGSGTDIARSAVDCAHVSCDRPVVRTFSIPSGAVHDSEDQVVGLVLLVDSSHSHRPFLHASAKSSLPWRQSTFDCLA